MNWTYYALALAGGAVLAVQVAVNSRLKRLLLDQPIPATLVSFTVGWLALASWCLVARYEWPSWEAIKASPWWSWTGGLLGVFYLTVVVIVGPRIGTAATLGLVVGGQMLMALVIDHFGLLGVEPSPVNLARAGGVALIIAGAALVAAFRE